MVSGPSDGKQSSVPSSDAQKNPVGGSPVVYLRVEDQRAALARAESMSERLHRGPLAIDTARVIARLIDPFGNVFGLDGPPGQQLTPDTVLRTQRSFVEIIEARTRTRRSRRFLRSQVWCRRRSMLDWRRR